MTNEEIAEEILHEAEELKIRVEVLELATKLRESSPKMSFLESLEKSITQLKNNL